MGGSPVAQADIEAALRLAADAPSTSPRRTHALRLVRECDAAPPAEWLMLVHVPVAWHLVASVLEVAPPGTVVECGEHSGGQHQDIIVRNREDDGYPRLVITWTSGLLEIENDERPFARSYPEAFIANRPALENALRRRLGGEVARAEPSRIAAARMLAQLTEPPIALDLVASADPAADQVWSLRDAEPSGRERVAVDMRTGHLRLSGGMELDAVEALEELAQADSSGRSVPWL